MAARGGARRPRAAAAGGGQRSGADRLRPQRRLLAALAAHLGRSVDVGRLVEMVWADAGARRPGRGACRPTSPGCAACCPAESGSTTTPDGYRLDADRAIVDVTAFADHLAAAATLDDPAARRDRLGAALALWPGAALTRSSTTRAGPRGRAARRPAGRGRQQHAEALLAAGRAAEAVAALEALVAAEPLREGAVGVLMRALVAGGRQGDALAAFARLRARLADELGLDPSPQLRELEQRVLRQELPVPSIPVAAGPEPTAHTGASRPAGAAQLLRRPRRGPRARRRRPAALPGGLPVRSGRGGQDAAGPARRRGGRRPLRRRRAARRVR